MSGEGGISQELMLWTLLNLIKNNPRSGTKIVLVGLQTRNEKTKYKILLPYTIHQSTFHVFNIIIIIQTRITPVLPLTIEVFGVDPIEEVTFKPCVVPKQ